jgi:hypothetical protein
MEKQEEGDVSRLSVRLMGFRVAFLLFVLSDGLQLHIGEF